jgi:hypothetical protein
MRPEPPRLTEAAAERTDEEICRMASNGIKMTGMPAFGEHHPPDEIAAITAFVGALPWLTVDDYSRLTGCVQEPSERAPTRAAVEASEEPSRVSDSRSE